MNTRKDAFTGMNRRDFVKRTATGLAGLGLMGSTNFAYAGGSDRIRVGVVGCGGRGTGAANNALTADPAVEIFALGDLFRDRLETSLNTLKNHAGDRVNVTDERTFSGFDNYTGVMESGIDIVILTAPPGFRPAHFEAAVERNLHVFMEKPVAVDSSGVRSIIETGEEGRRRNLSVAAGTQYRRQRSFVEAVRRIHEGMIGELVGGQEYYLTGPVWVRERRPEMTDLEWQCLNWYYFTWLSGDHIVEQFVHNIDTFDWIFQGHPVRAIGSGGRMVRTGEQFGHIYDNFSVEYEYSNGARVSAMCRQMQGVSNRNSNRVVGTKGVARVDPRSSLIVSHDGTSLFQQREPGNNAYVQTHADLIASIRAGEPLDESRPVAESTLTAILGREAAYTGRELSWEEVFNAEMNLAPAELEFGSLPVADVARPGVTRLERSFPG